MVVQQPEEEPKPACGIVVPRRGGIVFVREGPGTRYRGDFRTLTLPCGHREPGEACTVTARRELKEEAGAELLDPEALRLVGVFTSRRTAIGHDGRLVEPYVKKVMFTTDEDNVRFDEIIKNGGETIERVTLTDAQIEWELLHGGLKCPDTAVIARMVLHNLPRVARYFDFRQRC